MANVGYVLYEKYTSKLNGESSWAVANPLNGGLCLVNEGVLFDPGNTLLAATGNLWGIHRGEKSKAFAFENIEKAETGSFKHLWRTIYTLRIHTKSGETHYFLMPNQQRADQWTTEINNRK